MKKLYKKLEMWFFLQVWLLCEFLKFNPKCAFWIFGKMIGCKGKIVK